MALTALALPVAAEPVPTVKLADVAVLEEVLVVAQKRLQNLQVVPVAVTAHLGKDLERLGVQDAFDLATSTPALDVRRGVTTTRTNFRIRGVGTSAGNLGLESAVGLYVDGVYRARQSSMVNQMVDLASVEVLRGPQGTLFGRNTLAGAVLFNTVAPDHRGSDGFLELVAGNYDLLTLSGAGSISAIDDVLAFRASGFSNRRDGFVDDIELGAGEINQQDRWGGRLQALYTPNSSLSLRVIADHSEIDETCCAQLVIQDNLRPVALSPGSMPYAGTDEVLLSLGGTLFTGDQFYDFETAQSFLPVSEVEDSGVSVTLEWELDDFTLTAITGYRSYERHDRYDADGTDLNSIIRETWADQTAWTQELRISAEGSRWSFVAGLYYFNQDLDSVTTTEVGEDVNGIFSHTFVWFADTGGKFPLQAVPSFPLPSLPLFPPNSGARDVMVQDHEAWAVFGQADYYLTDSLMLTGGLRYTREDKELSGVFTEGSAPEFVDGVIAPPLVLEQFPALAPQDPVHETLDDGQWTGNVKLSWFADRELMLYASYSTGYKSGGTNTDRINPVFDYVFDPETSQSFEIGLKGEFPAQRLRLNMALHRTDIDDLQVTSVQEGGLVLLNAASVETWGGEVELTWLPADRLTLSLGYAKTVGEFRDFEEGPCWTAAPFHTNRPDPGDSTGGLNTTACDRSGDKLDHNPDQLRLAANQSFRINESIDGSLLLEYVRLGEAEIVSNDPFLKAPEHELLNLRLGLQLEEYDATVTLWGRNVLDEEYRMSGFSPIGVPGSVMSYPKEPATYGISLRKEF